MELPRLNVSTRLKEMMSYRKLAGPNPRALILRSQYWLDGACEHAAKQLGWEVCGVPTVMEGALQRDDIARFFDALTLFRPDFVLSINLSGMDTGGMFARLFEDLEIPYVAWFVDDPRTILVGSKTYASPYAIALTWDTAYESYLRDAGFPAVHWMPLAADTTVFNAEPIDVWDHPPTFVGNSMEDFAIRAWASPYLTPDMSAAAKRAFNSGRVTRDSFGTGPVAILDGEASMNLDAEQSRALEMLFFIEGTRRLRSDVVKRLYLEGLRVRGDEGWLRTLPDTGAPLGYLNELPAFYRACLLNLNITSIQMSNAVNQRVFDCPAAGGFLLTDTQPDLEKLFDVENEIAQYADLEECTEKFRWFRDNSRSCKPIIEKARKRILAEHTYAHRLKRIVEIVQERFC